MDEALQGNRGFYNCLGYKDILVQVIERRNVQIYHVNLAIFRVILGTLPEVHQSMLSFCLQCQATLVAQPYLNICRNGKLSISPGFLTRGCRCYQSVKMSVRDQKMP